MDSVGGKTSPCLVPLLTKNITRNRALSSNTTPLSDNLSNNF